MAKLTNQQQLNEIEGKINKNLYLICSIVTILTMTMMTMEFFTRGLFPPARIDFFYLGVLLIYSLHKELLRWLDKGKVKRQGECFVYGWIILTTILYFVNFLAKGYFNHSSGQLSSVLQNISFLTLEVLGIFIFTRCLKILKNVLKA